MIKRLWLFGILLAGIETAGCSKPTNYLYVQPPVPIHSMTARVKDVATGLHGGGAADLDVLWLIGGMDEQAQNFQAGATTFMTSFVANNSNWRMAAVRNASYPPQIPIQIPPLIGMPTVFDSTTPNPIPTFINAVMVQLNVNTEMDGEQLFDPVYYFLTQYSAQFLRPEATLVIIMTNDAPDGSIAMRTAQQMITFLSGLKGGNLSQVQVYGVLGADDLPNCDAIGIDGGWNYAGSQVEALINATGGQNYNLCENNYGVSLTSIGNSIASKLKNHVWYQTIYLGEVVDPSSVSVSYNGIVLAEGPQASGGAWYFNASQNAVVFYDLKFATGDIADVTITYSR